MSQGSGKERKDKRKSDSGSKSGSTSGSDSVKSGSYASSYVTSTSSGGSYDSAYGSSYAGSGYVQSKIPSTVGGAKDDKGEEEADTFKVIQLTGNPASPCNGGIIGFVYTYEVRKRHRIIKRAVQPTIKLVLKSEMDAEAAEAATRESSKSELPELGSGYYSGSSYESNPTGSTKVKRKRSRKAVKRSKGTTSIESKTETESSTDVSVNLAEGPEGWK